MNSQLKLSLDELEKVGTAHAAVSETMQRFLIERTLQDCPDWMESDYLLGGLVQASEILSGRTCQLVEGINREIRGRAYE